jgi:alpha-tubulin suppressor-like RCC1 family protein
MSKLRLLALCVASVLIAGAIVASAAMATPNGVMAWGENEEGQLGDGTTALKTLPVTLAAPSGVTQVAAGDEYSLALLETGKVVGWGDNFYNELGLEGEEPEEGPEHCGGFSCAKNPYEVPGLSGVTAIAASSTGGFSSLALLSSGKVKGWGKNFGEETPVEVSGLSEVTAISEGNEFSLALRANHTVMAWGVNGCGQLGDGTTTDKSTPTEVTGLTEVAAIAAGATHSLALLKNGTVVAWGCNTLGELGDGSTEASDVPQAVSGLSGVKAVSAGSRFSIALLESGGVRAWGTNYEGELGDGNEEGPEECPVLCSKVPVEVISLSNVSAISAGFEYSLALLENGTVKAWGEGNSGQLGDGEEESSYTPVAVSEITGDVTDVSAGETHSLAAGPPGPIVSKLSPATGSPGGGTSVEISGHNFSGVTSVKFGTASATAYEVVSPTLIKATSPAGVKTVHVQVTTSSGSIPTSPATAVSSFRYVAAGAPEYGRCVKVAKGTGKYNSSCTVEKAGSNFEWTPGVVKTHFTLSGGEGKLETVAKKKVLCTGETGAGEYSGTKALVNTTIELTGCAFEADKCTSAGAAEGEIRTGTLTGALGWKNMESGAPALDLAPSEGELVAEFLCGADAFVVQGSVIVGVHQNEMQLAPTLKYEATNGKQKPEHFDEEPNDVLEMSFGAAFEQTGLTVTTTQTNEEEVEVNAAI